MLSLLSQSYWDKYYIEANKIITFFYLLFMQYWAWNPGP